jgi:two-component system alkaline phosphatase synthesis response regulator PhoP
MVAMVNSKSNAVGKQSHLQRIVVIEDDETIADSLRFNLEHQGFRIRVANTVQSALDIILEKPPNLVLLDASLQGRSGVDLCRQLRSEISTRRVPILMLTCGLDETQETLRLKFGADDYLKKPFSIRELLARVNVILRRVEGVEGQGPIYDDGVLRIDPWNFSVRYEGREVRLTRKELRLLEELAQNQGRVILREVLFDRIWGMKHSCDSRTLDVHIRKLRQKLGNSKLIETITGIGYRLRKPQVR